MSNPSTDPTDAEPSPFCPEHQPWGTELPCRPCGEARAQHELWTRAMKEQAR